VAKGKSLAFAELYLVLANLFTRFEMQPYQTTEEDMMWGDCGGLAMPRKRLQVVARRKVERGEGGVGGVGGL